MVRLKLFFIIPVLFLLATSCPDDFEHDSSIRIINNSEVDMIFFSTHESVGDITKWKDYAWEKNIDEYVILKNSVGFETFRANDFKRLLKDGWIKYYILNYDSVRILPWERIRTEKIILKEVTFNSWEEIEACNFTITCP